MSLSALRHVRVAYSVPVAELSPLLVRLTTKVEVEAAEVRVPKALEVE